LFARTILYPQEKFVNMLFFKTNPIAEPPRRPPRSFQFIAAFKLLILF